MQGRILRLFLAAALFGANPATALAQNVSQFAKTLTAQKADFEGRIESLQRQVDDLFAEKSYCSAQERTEAYNKIRDLQRQIAALRNEYSAFKAGAIKTAATPGYGPQLDAAGIHPDDRKYWADDENALAKLRDSALVKANRIEQAPYRDCNEKKTATPTSPPAPKTTSPAGGKSVPPPPPPPEPKSTTPPPGGCTDREATERRLRIQEEILRLEEELIPIDGTKPEGRARQLQLRAEIDRLAGYLSRPCPPLLPPLKPTIPSPKTTPVQKGEGETGQANPPDYLGDFKRALAAYRAAKKNCDTDGMAAARTEMTAIQAAFKRAWATYEKTSSVYGSDADLPQWMENQRKEAESEGFLSAGCPHRIRPADPFEALEEDAADALDDLDDAMGDCDEDAVRAMIPKLEELSRQAHAAADAARAAGQYSKVNAAEAEAMARDLDEAIKDARAFKCHLKPLKRYLRLEPFYERILELHNREREGVHVPDLEWGYKQEWDAIGYSNVMSVTHQLVHASREGRGIDRENLQQTMIGWGPDRMLQGWIGEKRNFRPGKFPDVAIDGNWLNVAHYTQMIWPTTLKVGCGYSTGGGFGWLVCRYSPGGNKDGKPVGDLGGGTAIANDVAPVDSTNAMPKKPPPPPTATDDAPGGNEDNHPLVGYGAEAFIRHSAAVDCGDTAAAEAELAKLRYAIDELRKRLKAAKKAGQFSAVKPDDVQRQINLLESFLRAAEQRKPKGACPRVERG